MGHQFVPKGISKMDTAIIFVKHQNPIIYNLMKKVFFGIAVAIAATSASAFTTINDEYEGETVGKLGTDQWVIVLDEEQGLTWDCYSGGNVCKGTLKAGATPDMSGYFSDSEVNQIMESQHFEYINLPIVQQEK